MDATVLDEEMGDGVNGYLERLGNGSRALFLHSAPAQAKNLEPQPLPGTFKKPEPEKLAAQRSHTGVVQSEDLEARTLLRETGSANMSEAETARAGE